MIEKILYDFLTANQDIPVYTEIPAEMPSQFYVLEKTGSNIKNHIEQSTVAIQSYGSTLFESATMNEDLKGLMLNELPKEIEIGSVRLNSDYNFTNPTTKQHRYQAIFVITHH